MSGTNTLIKSFRVLCLLITISMCIYWIYLFNLNEGKSEINYRKFAPESIDAVVPTLTLCLDNPFLNDRLADFGTDNNSYFSFLAGKSFDKKMLRIDLDLVTSNITHHVKDYQIIFRNNTYVRYEKKESWISNNFNGIVFNRFYKCFSLHIPKLKDLVVFRVRLSNKIFRNGVRPTKFLMAYIHMQQQFLTPGNRDKWTWPKKGKKSFYKTRFLIQSYELYKKRNTKQNHCSENWKNFDTWILKSFEKEVGCKNPYLTYDKTLKMCESKDQIHRFANFPAIVNDGKYPMPCNRMENLGFEFLETKDDTDVDVLNKLRKDNGGFGYFWFGINFRASSYKEISNTR